VRILPLRYTYQISFRTCTIANSRSLALARTASRRLFEEGTRFNFSVTEPRLNYSSPLSLYHSNLSCPQPWLGREGIAAEAVYSASATALYTGRIYLYPYTHAHTKEHVEINFGQVGRRFL